MYSFYDMFIVNNVTCRYILDKYFQNPMFFFYPPLLTALNNVYYLVFKNPSYRGCCSQDVVELTVVNCVESLTNYVIVCTEKTYWKLTYNAHWQSSSITKCIIHFQKKILALHIHKENARSSDCFFLPQRVNIPVINLSATREFVVPTSNPRGHMCSDVSCKILFDGYDDRRCKWKRTSCLVAAYCYSIRWASATH